MPKEKGDQFLFNIGESQNSVDFLNKQSNRSLAIRFVIDLFIEKYGHADIASLLPTEYDPVNPSKYTVLIGDGSNNNNNEKSPFVSEKKLNRKEINFEESHKESSSDHQIELEDDYKPVEQKNDKVETTKKLSVMDDSKEEGSIQPNKDEVEPTETNEHTKHDDGDNDGDLDVEVPSWLV